MNRDTGETGDELDDRGIRAVEPGECGADTLKRGIADLVSHPRDERPIA